MAKLGGIFGGVENALKVTEKVATEVAKSVSSAVTPAVRDTADVFETAATAATTTATDANRLVQHLLQPDGNPAFLPPPTIGRNTTMAQLSAQLDKATGTHVTSGNQVQVFVDGQNALPQILKGIDSAQKSICYETYELDRSGTTVQQVVDHLIAAKQRGVDVRVVADAVGAREIPGFSNPMLDKLRAAGIQVKTYNPINPDVVDVRRDHRKSIVIDGQTAYLGGMNTGDKFLGGPQVPGRLHDIFTRIQGPAVSDVLTDFTSSWVASGGQPFTAAQVTSSNAPVLPATGGVTLRIVAHVPGQDANIRATYLAMINHATRSIDVENSYPMTDDLEAALCSAAKRGVKVRYIVGSHQGILGLETRSKLQTLLDAGVQVYLYPTPIHTKSLSVDGQICTIGSSNVDNVSLTRNREIIEVAQDPAFTQGYDQQVFDRDVVGDPEGAKTLELPRQLHDSLWGRLSEAVLSHVWPSSLQ